MPPPPALTIPNSGPWEQAFPCPDRETAAPCPSAPPAERKLRRLQEEQQWQPAGCASAIDLAEDDVERTQYRRHVSELMAAAEEIHRLQVRKARGAQLAAVRLV